VYEARDFAWDETLAVPHLAVAGLKKNAGPIAHAFYGQPDAAMFTVGVTGTNGKTSCALWTAQALARIYTDRGRHRHPGRGPGARPRRNPNST
jgi:UDP-N-acetylmuramoyl-L-alanyl-D-glutamate--2,6-diaminopimelate ligase